MCSVKVDRWYSMLNTLLVSSCLYCDHLYITTKLTVTSQSLSPVGNHDRLQVMREGYTHSIRLQILCSCNHLPSSNSAWVPIPQTGPRDEPSKSHFVTDSCVDIMTQSGIKPGSHEGRSVSLDQLELLIKMSSGSS